MSQFWGEVEAQHEGQTYKLRMDMTTLAAFEARTGRNALEWLGKVEDGMATVSDMIAMLSASLRRHHSDVSEDLAGDMLSRDTGVLMRLMQSAAPEPNEGN